MVPILPPVWFLEAMEIFTVQPSRAVCTIFGTLFRMTPAGALSTLVDFDGFNDGANPQNALTVGADGNLYGTTSFWRTGGRGTIFRLSFTDAPQITSQPVSRTASTGGTSRLQRGSHRWHASVLSVAK
jgi:hypothetical protein